MQDRQSKEPWEIYPAIWPTKTAFFTYLRGQLRNLWSHYPAKLKWKNAQLIAPPKDYEGRAKKLGQCFYCKQYFAASHLEVDHLSQAGECNSWYTSQQFLYRLLDCNDNWALACKPCHKCKSYAERMNISFSDAQAVKEAIRIEKEENLDDILAFCIAFGYNDNSTKQRRRENLERILKEA